MLSALIVEDEGLAATSLRASLGRLGYTASIVSTGRDAIGHAATHHPDVIFMDITLPGPVDGLEAAQRITERVNIPIIFLTAHADTATIARVAAMKPKGYQGYIVKPYSEKELQKTLEQALKQLKQTEAQPNVRS